MATAGTTTVEIDGELLGRLRQRRADPFGCDHFGDQTARPVYEQAMAGLLVAEQS